MRKIFNNLYNREVVTIMPGEYYISSSGELLSTLLGSCIAVCLYDEQAGIGGMNHFLLPESGNNRKSANGGDLYSSARYGVTAMEKLIMNMQLQGADRDRIRAKVFGGGNVLSMTTTSEKVGDKNIRFIKEYLKTEEIPVISEDTGEKFSRKVLFNTGDFSVKLSKTPVDSSLIHDEEEYMERLSRIHQETQIIFF